MDNLHEFNKQSEDELERLLAEAEASRAKFVEEQKLYEEMRRVQVAELDRKAEEMNRRYRERIYTDAQLLRVMHSATWYEGAGLPSASEALREAFPSNLALYIGHGAWNVTSRLIGRHLPERVVHSGQIRVSRTDSDEKLEATAEFLGKLWDAVDEAYPESEYGYFRMEVSENFSNGYDTVSVIRADGVWTLVSEWTILQSSDNLTGILSEIRETYHYED